MLEIEKRKIKYYKLVRNYSSRLARALSTIRTSRARAEEEETDPELHISGNAGTIPK